LLLVLFYLLIVVGYHRTLLSRKQLFVVINTAAWAYHKHHRTLLEYATRLQLLKGTSLRGINLQAKRVKRLTKTPYGH